MTKDAAPSRTAKHMYWQGYSCTEISKILHVNPQTVYSWKRMHKWDKASVIERTNAHIEARLCLLIAKEIKTDKDYVEIDKISKILERTARIQKYANGGNETDLNPKIKNRFKSKKNKKSDNSKVFNEEQKQQLLRAIDKNLFPHQKKWLEQGEKHFMRIYLKSRQIGATWAFSLEALKTALATEKNQIFISASKKQAEVFKANIISFVEKEIDIKLKGEIIKLGPETRLYFLGTNKNTAQSYSGDLYIDEFFWIPKFEDIKHVASGMTTLDDRRITYFSTPSTTSHQGYHLWDGSHFNKGRAKKDHINLNISHPYLKNGKVGDDGYFRQSITIEDAVNSGYSLVTIEKLRKKYAPDIYNNLFMCEFVNDMNSIFKLAQLEKCMVDSAAQWKDYHPYTDRPLNNTPVYIGYDPSRSRDNSSLVVVAPPSEKYKTYRLIERLSFHGLDFDGQANQIRAITRKYNVAAIAIDATGIGLGVYELVKQFYSRVKKITYNVEAKNNMVLKAQQLFSTKKLQIEASFTDVIHSFLTIHQAPTASGRQITYKASRSATTGHADLAWATMHALIQDGFGSIENLGQTNKKSSISYY